MGLLVLMSRSAAAASVDPNTWFPSDTVAGDFWRLGDSTLATNSTGDGGVPEANAVCGYVSSLRASFAANHGGLALKNSGSKPIFAADGTYASGALKFRAGSYDTLIAGSYDTFNPLETGYTAAALVRFSGTLSSSKTLVTVGGDDNPVGAAIWNASNIRYGDSSAGAYKDYAHGGVPDMTAWHSFAIRVEGSLTPGATRTEHLYIDGEFIDSFTTTYDGAMNDRFLFFARAANVDVFFRAGFGAECDIGGANMADLHSWLVGGS